MAKHGGPRPASRPDDKRLAGAGRRVQIWARVLPELKAKLEAVKDKRLIEKLLIRYFEEQNETQKRS